MRSLIAFLLIAVACSGCAMHIPKEALTLQPDSMYRRQMQTRRFDTRDELRLLQAGAAVLQDLGFNLDESETSLGVIVGSKSRDATDGGQVASMLVLGALLGTEVTYDMVQNIKASLVTRPVGPGGTNARVTFQRVVLNTRNEVARIESLEDPKLYQEFFEKLSKAVFLQAQNI